MFEFRRAQTADLPLLTEIEQQSGFNEWNAAQMQECLQNNHVWVGLRQGVVIGFIVCSHVLDEAEVLNIVVASQVQGMGFGKKLLTAALQELSALKVLSCFLEVSPQNRNAVALYEKNGFKQVGLRKNYYAVSRHVAAGKQDARVMQLQLSI